MKNSLAVEATWNKLLQLEKKVQSLVDHQAEAFSRLNMLSKKVRSLELAEKRRGEVRP